MQLSELRKRNSSPSQTLRIHADEELVVDRRDHIKPAESVESKLHALLEAQTEVASLHRPGSRWA